MRSRLFPGAAFSVLAGGQVLALDGVGSFTYDQPQVTVTASTVYDLASLTKVIATTSMAMLLYQNGKLSLDQPLVQILPGFAQGEAAGSARHRVTLRMLLAHTLRLARLRAPVRRLAKGARSCSTPAFILPLQSPPGEPAEYSDPGFILLGEALAAIAGEELGRFCAREVFAPLGMTSTCFRPPSDWRTVHPADRRGHNLPPSHHPGRGAG